METQQMWSPWAKISLDQCYTFLLSPGTNVFLGQLLPQTKTYWTTVILDNSYTDTNPLGHKLLGLKSQHRIIMAFALMPTTLEGGWGFNNDPSRVVGSLRVPNSLFFSGAADLTVGV